MLKDFSLYLKSPKEPKSCTGYFNNDILLFLHFFSSKISLQKDITSWRRHLPTQLYFLLMKLHRIYATFIILGETKEAKVLDSEEWFE